MNETESARRQALLDWAAVGEFNDAQYSGDAKQAYNNEAARIERHWDNQGV